MHYITSKNFSFLIKRYLLFFEILFQYLLKVYVTSFSITDIILLKYLIFLFISILFYIDKIIKILKN